MINIAIFGSGRGSNARAIMEYFEEHPEINIRLIVSNNSSAGILDLADDYSISKWIADKSGLKKPSRSLEILKSEKIDFIVLAGFLWLVPKNVIDAYKTRIINIHPALLPNYGGKGMYGMNIHKAVHNNNESVSGITIHEVDEIYDNGRIVEQKKCDISVCKSPQEIADTILKLEHEHYAPTIEKWILSK